MHIISIEHAIQKITLFKFIASQREASAVLCVTPRTAQLAELCPDRRTGELDLRGRTP